MCSVSSASISVLMPVYNGASTLAQAIESILIQELPSFEFLIIDDCSTDNSADVIRQYAAQDPRINAHFHSVNQGLAATLNEGLNLVKGEFVARMDQDDESLRQRLQIQQDFLQQHPQVAVVGSYAYYMGKEAEKSQTEIGLPHANDKLVTLPTDSDTIKSTLPSYNCLYHPAVMLRREAILQLGGYRAAFKNAEDYDLWLRASKQFELANIPQPLLRYRFSLSGMTLSRKWEQLYFVYLAQIAHKHPEFPFSEVEATAQQQLSETDKQYFMQQVAIGTINELIDLKQWWDALLLVRQFTNDIGGRRSAALLKTIIKAWLPRKK